MRYADWQGELLGSSPSAGFKNLGELSIAALREQSCSKRALISQLLAHAYELLLPPRHS